LREIGEKITTLPSDWEFHPQVKKIYDLRRKSISEGKGIDWGTAEALAFSTLIHEGFQVRLSGQDVERGTFSHRHSVLIDQRNENKYIPVNTVREGADKQQF
jgi:2-oxoglutarate dehydrogenase complex dehydrogenase (E1) component-like enzyme